MGPGATVTDGVEQTKTACKFEQQHENGQSLTQDPDCDEGIQDQKPAKGTGIPLITSLHNISSQHTSGALNTEHNEAHREHTDGRESVLSNSLFNLNTDISAYDKCVQLGECSPSLQPAEILETDTNDAWYSMYNTLNEISLSDASVFEQNLPFNHNIDQKDEKGYRAKGTGIPLITTLQNMPSQHISDALNTEHNEAQIEHTDGEDRVLSNTPTLLRPDADTEDEKIELSRGALVNTNTDTSADDKCLKLEECSSSLQPEEIMDISETDTNDDSEAMYDTLLDEISPSDDKAKLELPFNHDIDKMDEEGYTPLYKAALEGHLEGVDDLISRGANPNKPSKGGLRPLHTAAQEGHTHIVDFLILQGADVNVECERGRTPLHTTAAKGYLDILECLVAEGPDLNQEDNTGWTSFNAAVQYGHLEAVKYLITEGAKQNRYAGMTPLYAAARYGHLHIIKFFLSKGADVNEEDDEGMIPLHGAADRGHLEVMEYLIQQGSDVNKADAGGWTPFNAAVVYGHLEAVKYLITEGSKQNRYDGMTPLYAAAEFGHLDIVEFFVSKGADVNEEDDGGMIPLHGAAAEGHLKVMEYLLHQGSDTNTNDNDGWTPLHAAVRNGHLEVIKVLLAKGALGTSFEGLTALYIATQYDHVDVVNFLVSNGYDVNERNERGKSPLHAACYIGNMDIVELLVQHNANVNEQDHDGWKPLEAAAQEGHQEIVNYLALNGADMHVRDIDGLTPLRAASNTTHPHAIEGISPSRGDPDEEETGDTRSGGHQNIITRGYVTVTMKDGHTQLESQVDNADEGYDCIQADILERGADEPSLKSLPTRTNDDGKGGLKECNPFIHAKLKRPDKSEQDPMLDQMEAIKCTGTMEGDTTTNVTDCSLPSGPQRGQYNGIDPPYLQTMETDGHPSEQPESRCHSLIDGNRETRESSSPMTAGDDRPINGTSTELESSFPTHPPAVFQQKSYDGNPVSSQRTSPNPVWKIRNKRRRSVDRCPSILALVQTFLQMCIGLAIFLAGSPVLVAGRGIIERVTLQAGKPGVVPFHLQWLPSDTFKVFPYYTLGFQTEPRPFCINGQIDIVGFKNPSQLRRFTTSVTDLDTSPSVNIMIDNVDTLDEDGYVLTTVWHSFENVRYEIVKKEIVVQVPPGSAKCFITFSKNVDDPYEVHCRSTTGSVTTTISCYQDDRKIDVTGDVTDNGQITSGIFLLPHITHFSCCSHVVSLNVSGTMCNDFVWPHSKGTTKQTVNTDPTSVTTPTPQVESHLESGACRLFVLPSLWPFTYLLVYILAFVTLY